MISYNCRISDNAGKISLMEKTASDESSLIKMIHDEGYFLISYEKVEYRKKRFSKSVILEFTATMSLMLKAGLTVKDALNVASHTFEKEKASPLVTYLREAINKGISFPQAINQLPHDFTPLYRGMIKIGDKTGSLDSVFEKLSQFLRDEKEMNDKMKGAMMYPLFVFNILILALTGLFLFVLPRLQENFSNKSLQMIFDRLNVVVLFFIIPLSVFTLFLLFLFVSYRFRGALGIFSQNLVLKLPVIGKILLNRASLNTLFSMEILSSSSFPLEEAIRESADLLSNESLKQALKRIESSVIQGEKLSEAFMKETLWPRRIAIWIAIGEASGDVSAVFNQLRIYYQGEQNKMISRLMVMVEPVMTVLVGFFIILFVILFVVPLFGIIGGGF